MERKIKCGLLFHSFPQNWDFRPTDDDVLVLQECIDQKSNQERYNVPYNIAPTLMDGAVNIYSLDTINAL